MAMSDDDWLRLVDSDLSPSDLEAAAEQCDKIADRLRIRGEAVRARKMMEYAARARRAAAEKREKMP